MDRTYTQKMGSGNPMGVATMYPGGTMYAPKMPTNYYVGKSTMKGSSVASVRSKSMRSGMSRRSHLSKRKPTKRFNEDLDTMSRRSKASYHPSRASVKQNRAPIEKPTITDKKKKVIEQIEKMDDNIEKLRSTFNLDKEERDQREKEFKEPPKEEKKEEANPENNELDREENAEEDGKQKDDQQLHDEIDSLYYGSYTESRRSEQSRRSVITSATYISKLEKELREERRAREKLAQELEEIKKISSEISSHLGLQNAIHNNQQ